MADSSDSVVSNNANNCKDLSAVQSSDHTDENKTDKVMEPILVEEYKYNRVPTTINNILRYLKNLNPTYTNIDILVCLIYILLLENGFVPKEEYEGSIESHTFDYKRVKKFSEKLPIGWKRQNLYTFSFVLPPFVQNEIQVVCLVTSSDVLVNCIINQIEEACYSICLDSLLYFAGFDTKINNLNLQNVMHLSKNFKEAIGYRAKQAILQINEVDSEFEQLPPEIVLKIMGYLDVKSLTRLGQVNYFCNRVMKTPTLWISLILKDFAPRENEEMSGLKLAGYEKLQSIYKKYFLYRSHRRALMNRHFVNLCQVHL